MKVPTLEDVRAEKARRSLTEYTRQAWPILEPGRFMTNWHIDAIGAHLEAVRRGDIRRLIINMPPRAMKSLLVSVFFPSWWWADEPWIKFLTASYAARLALRDTVKMRDVILSPWYTRNFGAGRLEADLAEGRQIMTAEEILAERAAGREVLNARGFRFKDDQNTKTFYQNTAGGFRFATSVGGAATGEGADAILVDDPHAADDAYSDANREGALIWWDNTMSSRLNDLKTGRKIIVMQRIHEKDLSGHALEAGGYEHLMLPMEYDPRIQIHVTSLGWADPRTEPGALLWEERVGAEEVKGLKKDLGSFGYAGQYQQDPAPAGGGVFKRVWWRFWHNPGEPLPPVAVKQADGSIFHCPVIPLPENMDAHAQTWDMAFKKTNDTDLVCGQVWAKSGARAFLRAQTLERRNFPESVEAVRALTRAWPQAAEKLIEDKANGPAVVSTLEAEIPGIIAVNPEGGKEARAAAASVFVEAGNIYLPHPSLAPWVEQLITKAAKFPKVDHDDEIDAMTQLIIRWFGGRAPSVVTMDQLLQAFGGNIH